MWRNALPFESYVQKCTLIRFVLVMTYITKCPLALILALDVQKLDGSIHRMNCFPAEKSYGNQLRYLVDSDLSGG